jgi:hypothetical protein
VTRTVAAPAQAVLDGGTPVVVAFVEMMLSTPLRLNTSAATINWNGNDWTGAGSMGAIEEIDDTPADAKGVRFTLSGVPSALLAVALAEPVRNKACTIYFGILDPTTHAVLDSIQAWSGTLDTMPITQSGETCTISATAEHAGANFARPKPLRYTDADQQRLYPGDTSLRFVVSQANHQDTWPAAAFFKQ